MTRSLAVALIGGVFAALATYEAVVLVLATAGFVLGGSAALWVLVRGAPAVRALQDAQARRIEALPPPEG